MKIIKESVFSLDSIDDFLADAPSINVYCSSKKPNISFDSEVINRRFKFTKEGNRYRIMCGSDDGVFTVFLQLNFKYKEVDNKTITLEDDSFVVELKKK